MPGTFGSIGSKAAPLQAAAKAQSVCQVVGQSSAQNECTFIPSLSLPCSFMRDDILDAGLSKTKAPCVICKRIIEAWSTWNGILKYILGKGVPLSSMAAGLRDRYTLLFTFPAF